MNRLLYYLAAAVLLFPARSIDLSAAVSQPVETGLVDWTRDFDAALRRSVEERKPVLALFQEVPGCSGTQEFGRDVLSHPLIVEAIESEFIPVLIYNNRGGRDAELLTRYNEPAWNYQVIRFLDSDGSDIIPRKDRVWTLGAVARRMAETLSKAGKTVPLYLEGLALENNNPDMKDAVFAMFCFWTGEMKLGGIRGVVKTEAGFLDRREVTRVWYDESRISLEDLARRASDLRCADAVFVKTRGERKTLKTMHGPGLRTDIFDERQYRKAGSTDQKRQIQGSIFTHLNLTQYQLTKVNAIARQNRVEALDYLSPRQAAKLHMLTKRSWEHYSGMKGGEL
jgi:hypothetical protein